MGNLQYEVPYDDYDGEDVDLLALTERDREVAKLKDEDFKVHTWDQLKRIVSANDLAQLTRTPSQTRRYLHWRSNIAKRYDSVTDFLLQERLHWTPKPNVDPEAGPAFDYKSSAFFTDPSDFKILLNDWPYGVDKGIWHLIIWTKTPIPVEPDMGDLTPRSRVLIEDFVNRVFREKVKEKKPGDSVLWLKNWPALQSIRGVDHVHVLVRNVDESVIQEWTK